MEERGSDSVSVTVGDKMEETEASKNNKMAPPPKMPEGVFNGFCLFVVTIILIVTYVASPHWNTVSFQNI